MNPANKEQDLPDPAETGKYLVVAFDGLTRTIAAIQIDQLLQRELYDHVTPDDLVVLADAGALASLRRLERALADAADRVQKLRRELCRRDAQARGVIRDGLHP